MRKLISGLFAVLLIATLAACSSSGSDDAADEKDKTTTTAADKTTTTESGTEKSTTTEGGSTPGDSNYTAALAKGLAGGDEADGDLVLSDDEAACVAESWIGTIGTDRLSGKDITPEDLEDPDFTYSDLELSASEGQEMIDAFGDCDVDIETKLLDSLSQDLDAEQKDCLEGELTPEIQNQLLVEALTQEDFSDELGQILEDLQTTCNLG